MGPDRPYARGFVAALGLAGLCGLARVATAPGSGPAATVALSARAAAAAAPSTLSEESAARSQPDIVLITLDDVGSNDLWDSTDLPEAVAPNIRAVAGAGVVLTSYYGQAFCSPARAALLSGKFTHRTGFSRFESEGIELDAYSNWSVPLGAPLMPEVLRREGYATHGIGKWNVGHCNERLMPWSRGFESFAGYFTSGINYMTHATKNFTKANGAETQWFDLTVARDGEGVRNGTRYRGTHTTPLFTQFALDVLTDRDDRPAFLWLAFHAMHGNDGCDQVDAGLSADEAGALRLNETLLTQLSLTRRRYAMGLRAIDEGVGKVRARLLAKHAAGERDFVLVLHSDNGASACSTDCAGSNAPRRGYKFTDFDGGTRVPCVVESSLLPPRRRGARYGGLVHHVDWLQTFLSLAGGGSLRDDDATYDSLDVWPHLAAEAPSTAPARSTVVFSRAGKGCEIPNFKGSYLGRFPLVSADFWTRDHLSERSRP